MARSGLEERLEAITREFVKEIVATIRGASFADVAQLDVGSPRRGRPPAARPSQPRGSSSQVAAPTRVSASPARENGRARQTAGKRAELADRVVKALESAGQSLGVRALSGELGVAPDLLAVPLKELRAAGRIAKHGEKRATTYSVA